MTVHRLRFFALREEVENLLTLGSERFQHWIVPAHGNELREPRQGTSIQPALLGTRRVYIAPDLPTADSLKRRPAPAKWGWVQLDLPSHAPEGLLLAELAARSDWSEHGKRLDEGRSELTFRPWAKLIRSLLTAQRLEVRNLKTGAASPTSERVTARAAELARAGISLRQEGAANQEYVLVK
jgi:hypothetical protein